MISLMSNKSILLLSILLFLMVILGCTGSDQYSNLPYNEKKNIVYSGIESEDFIIDGSMSSMDGQWLMKDSLLYFVDRHVVGVNVYDKNGMFMDSFIDMGRGPNEMISQSAYSTFDLSNGNFVMYDSNYSFNVFKQDHTKEFVSETWVYMAPKLYDGKEYQKLVEFPTPSSLAVYDYNFMCDRVCVSDNVAFLPVIIEHPKYNGYDKGCNAKDCWKNSSTFLAFDIHDILGSFKLFGSFPPVYSKHNIPIFATYDFQLVDGKFYVSYAADPKIYVMDCDGTLLHSFGSPGNKVSCKFPDTNTFEEYEECFEIQRQQYGHYDRLFSCADFLFREYYDDDCGWNLQVYENEILVGDFPLDCHLDIFGCCDGSFFAFKKIDYEGEAFVLTKFRLKT